MLFFLRSVQSLAVKLPYSKLHRKSVKVLRMYLFIQILISILKKITFMCCSFKTNKMSFNVAMKTLTHCFTLSYILAQTYICEASCLFWFFAVKEITATHFYFLCLCDICSGQMLNSILCYKYILDQGILFAYVSKNIRRYSGHSSA